MLKTHKKFRNKSPRMIFNKSKIKTILRNDTKKMNTVHFSVKQCVCSQDHKLVLLSYRGKYAQASGPMMTRSGNRPLAPSH